MKAKQIALATVAMIGMNLGTTFVLQADTIDELNQQQQQVIQESQLISTDVQHALTDANKTYQKVDQLKNEINDNQKTLTSVTKEIKEKETTIERRKEVMAERLRSLQTNQVSQSQLEVLLNAKSVQDFINKMYAINVMQNAEKRNFETLNQAVKQLHELKGTAETTQQTLKVSQASLEVEAKNLDTKVAKLKEQLASKQTVLQKIASSKAVEETRLKEEAERVAKEKAEQEAAAKKAEQEAVTKQAAAQQAAATAASSTEQTKTEIPTQNATPAPSPQPAPSPSNSNGKVLYMESTAYSYAETGYSITATGLDLRKNPMAIAVDPRVIPLGSIVEVQGYGMAIAADTGGAIKGNIVDVHFKTVAECKQWGRRHNVKVTVLS